MRVFLKNAGGNAMYYTGFADEAAVSIDGQIAATKELGWQFIESRNVSGLALHDLPDCKFEEVCAKLDAAGIRINCIGSEVANWKRDPFLEADYLLSIAQLERSIRRAKILGCKMIRGMSFRAQLDLPAFDENLEKNVIRKVKYLVSMCEDAGILYLHENCNNNAGMSWKHTLRLLEAIDSPALKLVFDTGNPVMLFDRSEGDALTHMQNSWEYYSKVKQFVHYVHIKDGVSLGNERTENGFGKMRYSFPGEGDGHVREILTDLFKNGFDGGLSIEPHMGRVFHEPSPSDDSVNTNYMEYGRRLMALVNEIKASLK